jgi:3-hydroxyisobutyrate dehydrogenase-like beta-hydroxyacid dehydrogenase
MPALQIENIGFIGLGNMGLPVARNILKAGFHLKVFDLVSAKMEPLVEMGASLAISPREAALGADVVITCLLDDQSVRNAVMGEDGLLTGLRGSGIHINTATVSPRLSQELAELHAQHGCYYIAAPIFGRPNAVEAGTLLTYVGGDEDIVRACGSLFDAYTQRHIYLGQDQKLANQLKLTVNFMLISLIELFAEVYSFTEKSGIPSGVTQELIATVLVNPSLEDYSRRICRRDFQPAFDLTTGFKDVSLMREAATDIHVPLPLLNIVYDRFLSAMANDLMGKDWSVISEIARQNSGLAG